MQYDGGMAKLKIEYNSVGSLIPYARNSRTHSDTQVMKVASSIKEFGFLNPVIVDGDNGIIAGHCRIEAAKKLGIEKVPTIEASYLTDAQRRAYIIADNRLALDSDWDDEMLRVEFDELTDVGFDVELTGFDLSEIAHQIDEPDENLIEQQYSEVFNIIIGCENEMEQEQIFNKLDSEGYKCRVQSL